VPLKFFSTNETVIRCLFVTKLGGLLAPHVLCAQDVVLRSEPGNTHSRIVVVDPALSGLTFKASKKHLEQDEFEICYSAPLVTVGRGHRCIEIEQLQGGSFRLQPLFRAIPLMSKGFLHNIPQMILTLFRLHHPWMHRCWQVCARLFALWLKLHSHCSAVI
jgi:hypothetical protein